MNEEKKVWGMTGAAILVLVVAMWEVMAGYLLALSVIIGLALWENSKRKVKFSKRMLIYLILGVILAVLDLAAGVDIARVGPGRAVLEMGMLAMSGVLVGMTVWWEKKRR